MRRAQRACILACVVWAGCVPRVATPFATAGKLSHAARRPDGVAIDPTSQPPGPQSRAPVENGIVTLRTPLGFEAARVTLQGFFEGVTHEDLAALSAVASPTAMVSNMRGGSLESVHNYGFLWRQRFAKFRYEAVDRGALYRESEIETFDTEHADALPVELTLASSGETLAPEDVVLRVRMLGQPTKADRIFGESLTFWLRRDEDRYVIYRIAEDVPQ